MTDYSTYPGTIIKDLAKDGLNPEQIIHVLIASIGAVVYVAPLEFRQTIMEYCQDCFQIAMEESVGDHNAANASQQVQ